MLSSLLTLGSGCIDPGKELPEEVPCIQAAAGAPERPGCELRLGYDDDADGILERESVQRYDAAGYLSYQSQSDATWDYVTLYAYDACGCAEERRTEQRSPDFEGGSVTTAACDGYGNAVRERYDYWWLDGAGEGENSYPTSYANIYEDDALVARTQDINANQTIDRVDSYVRDDDGRILGHAADYDADGVVDWRVVYTIGGNGKIDTAAITHPGGSSRQQWAYDAYDRLLTIHSDDGADGVVEATMTYLYEEESTEPFERRDDTDADGRVDGTVAYAWDCAD